MRLGGQILKQYETPEQWSNLIKEMKYTAVYFPVDHTASKELIKGYTEITTKNNWIIAEIGAWSNPLSNDPFEENEAIQFCQNQLALAEEVGACCCVNIAGSMGDKWDGPHKDSFSDDTFALIVDSVRVIIDAVKPKRTFYTLEPMPWMVPDSPDTYIELIKAIDRPSFAAHLDPVNMICSPRAYYYNSQFLDECFDKLGPYIKSCHAKDIYLENTLTTHLNECTPGKGFLDFRKYLSRVNMLDKDIPFMMEHMSLQEEVNQAAAYIRGVAKGLDIEIN